MRRWKYAISGLSVLKRAHQRATTP